MTQERRECPWANPIGRMSASQRGRSPAVCGLTACWPLLGKCRLHKTTPLQLRLLSSALLPPSHTCCDRTATGSLRIPLAEQQGSRRTIGICRGAAWKRKMSDLPIAAERYRKDAAVFSELAKSAETPFIRDYYWRLVRRYLMHAKNQEKLARRPEGLAAGSHQDNQIVDAEPRASLGSPSARLSALA